MFKVGQKVVWYFIGSESYGIFKIKAQESYFLNLKRVDVPGYGDISVELSHPRLYKYSKIMELLYV